MHRTNIYLTERQMTRLKTEAGLVGVSLAEWIRRILDEHLERQKGGKR